MRHVVKKFLRLSQRSASGARLSPQRLFFTGSNGTRNTRLLEAGANTSARRLTQKTPVPASYKYQHRRHQSESGAGGSRRFLPVTVAGLFAALAVTVNNEEEQRRKQVVGGQKALEAELQNYPNALIVTTTPTPSTPLYLGPNGEIDDPKRFYGKRTPLSIQTVEDRAKVLRKLLEQGAKILLIYHTHERANVASSRYFDELRQQYPKNLVTLQIPEGLFQNWVASQQNPNGIPASFGLGLAPDGRVDESSCFNVYATQITKAMPKDAKLLVGAAARPGQASLLAFLQTYDPSIRSLNELAAASDLAARLVPASDKLKAVFDLDPRVPVASATETPTFTATK